MKKLKSVTVKVPATSANCGPGFDSVGFACNLYNTLTLSLQKKKSITLEAKGEGEGLLKPSENNFAVKAAYLVLKELGQEKLGINIKMKNAIPMSRGLGSSSAAIVSGMVAANAIFGEPLGKEKIFELATKMEGHPDNVAPALYGGVTASILEEGKPYTVKLKPPSDLQMVAVVPEFPLATKQAREVLPKKVTFADATFNVSRVAFLIAAFCQNKMELLPYALEDRLHQPYRGKLIPAMPEVFAAAKAGGAYGSIISGSGSTLLSFVPKSADADKIGRAMCQEFTKLGKTAIYHKLDFDNKGARVINMA